MPVGKAPVLNLVEGIELSAILDPAIFALLLTSSLTIDPSTMFAELTCMPLGNVPVAILLCAIAALPLMSPSTIVASLIFAEVTC